MNDGSDRHLPEQAPIEAVLADGFRFGGMSHRGAILSLPGRTQSWSPPASAFELTANDLDPILQRSDRLDLVLIGTGRDPAVLAAATEAAIRAQGLGLEVTPTRAAVRTLNILLSEDRRVAAALMVAGDPPGPRR